MTFLATEKLDRFEQVGVAGGTFAIIMLTYVSLILPAGTNVLVRLSCLVPTMGITFWFGHLIREKTLLSQARARLSEVIQESYR